MLRYTPWVWAWRPPLGVDLETPQVWAWRPPRCGPGDPPGVGLETPQVWAWRPPRCGPGDSSRPDPSTSHLGVGLETPPPGHTPQLPPHLWAWKPARQAGIPPSPEICCKACRDTTCKACWDTTCNACWDTTPL